MSELLHLTVGESIDVRTESASDLWPTMVDPSQIENVLLNVVINARDAMERGVAVTIETANTQFDDAAVAARTGVEPGDYVVLAVSDNGIGMPPETQAHAFEPFFTTKGLGHGSGLGLSMVYGFAKQSGGNAKIDSAEGFGTTVRLFLPRAKSADEPMRQDSVPEPAPAGSETVLVVEDNEDVRALAAKFLEALGYRVLKAGDGAGALATLERHMEIDLLFTDVILPGEMNGPEIANAAHSIVPGIVVLYMSGYTESAVENEGRVLEGVELLSKPFSKAELARAVRKVLDVPVLVS